MRRKHQEVTDKNEIYEIINQSEVCRLGLNDEIYPHIVPLNYGFERINDKYTFYFHSAQEGRKMDLIKRNPHASFEIDFKHELLKRGTNDEIACTYSYQYRSIMGTGIITIVEDDDEKTKGILLMMKHLTGRDNYKIMPEMLKRVCVYKLDVNFLSAKSHD